MEAGQYTRRLLTASEAHMRVVRADFNKLDQVALDEALKFIMDEVERSSDMGVPRLTFTLLSDEEKREYAPIHIKGARMARALECMLHDLGYRANVWIDVGTDRVNRVEMSWRS